MNKSEPEELKIEALTQAQQNIKDLLTNKLLNKDKPIDQNIFKSQLVIKLKVPKQSYIKRSEKFELGYILRSYSKTIIRAYESAYEDLYKDMQMRGDNIQKKNSVQNQLFIRNICSFKSLLKYNQNQSLQDLKELPQKRRYLENSQEQIFHTCEQMSSGYLDAFIISYNSLIYSLEHFCGFKVKAFITSHAQKDLNDSKKQASKDQFQQVLYQNSKIDRVIYIFLYLPNEGLIKAANKYHIKKQIDYANIDPFLNQPIDSTRRPIRLVHKQQKQLKQNSNNQEQEQNQVQQIDVKTIDRKLGLILQTKDQTQVMNPAELSQKQKRNYVKFKQELEAKLFKLIGQNYKILKTSEYNKPHDDFNYFNDPKNEDSLTAVEKDYLYRVNRGKVNPGVEKRYVQVKKQRKYFQILKELSKKYGYDVYDEVPTYTQFKLANKKNKFFSRLDKMLLYKQTVISPYGQLALFNTMESIKLSYLVLKEHIRVQNFYKLGCSVFTLSNNYEKYGQLGIKKGQKVQSKFHYFYFQTNKNIKEGIQGGLNGQNLQGSWPVLRYWKTNFNNIRNYIGQSKTFQIFMKTQIIYLFLFLAPLGVGLQIVKLLIIDVGTLGAGFVPEVYFYLAYMLCITIVYGIFQEKYRRAQMNYMQDFVETTPNIQFIHQYKGPYMRDIVTDNASTYNQKFSPSSDTIKIWLTFFVIFVLLAIQIGFYYGIRLFIVELSFRVKKISIGFEAIKLCHFIGYSFYFIINQVLIQFPIPWLARVLTQRQNRPTKQAFSNSQMLKLFIYSIGLQVFPPVDLLFLQNAARTSCSSYWCEKELEAYVYSKYYFIIAYSLISLVVVVVKTMKRKAAQSQGFHPKKIKLNFSTRLSMFLSFVQQQSKKKPCNDLDLVQQTVAIIQFATFTTILPIAPTLSLLKMLINYYIQRTQLLHNNQRPIPKPQNLKPYRKIFVAIGHWMLFFNFSRMILSLQWLQYIFPELLLSIANPPSQYSIMTVRYTVILLLMLIYYFIMNATVFIVKKNHSIMDKRKLNMQQKQRVWSLNAGAVIQIRKPKPLSSISRTYINIKNKLNQASENSQEQEFNQQSSSKQMLNEQNNA